MKKRASIIDIKETADLAKLSLSESELASFSQDMEAIIAFADTVADAPFCEGDIAKRPFFVMRDDTPAPSPSREELLALAPQKEDGYVKAPRVVE